MEVHSDLWLGLGCLYFFGDFGVAHLGQSSHCHADRWVLRPRQLVASGPSVWNCGVEAEAEEHQSTITTNLSMHEYLVIFERAADGGWGAYAPDLPGLGVAAETREEVSTLIREGIAIHIAGLREDGLPIPAPVTTAERILVAA